MWLIHLFGYNETQVRIGSPQRMNMFSFVTRFDNPFRHGVQQCMIPFVRGFMNHFDRANEIL